MSTVSTCRVQSHPRTIQVSEPGLVAIRVNRDVETLEVEEFELRHRRQETPVRGFVCTKFGGEKVHVLIAVNGSGDDVCTCSEFAHRAVCIHALGFRALLKRGELSQVPSLRC